MNRPTIRIEQVDADAPHYIEQGDACYILVRLNAPDATHATHEAVYVLCNCPKHCLIPCGKHGKPYDIRLSNLDSREGDA